MATKYESIKRLTVLIFFLCGIALSLAVLIEFIADLVVKPKLQANLGPPTYTQHYANDLTCFIWQLSVVQVAFECSNGAAGYETMVGKAHLDTRYADNEQAFNGPPITWGSDLITGDLYDLAP